MALLLYSTDAMLMHISIFLSNGDDRPVCYVKILIMLKLFNYQFCIDMADTSISYPALRTYHCHRYCIHYKCVIFCMFF